MMMPFVKPEMMIPFVKPEMIIPLLILFFLSFFGFLFFDTALSNYGSSQGMSLKPIRFDQLFYLNIGGSVLLQIDTNLGQK